MRHLSTTGIMMVLSMETGQHLATSRLWFLYFSAEESFVPIAIYS